MNANISTLLVFNVSIHKRNTNTAYSRLIQLIVKAIKMKINICLHLSFFPVWSQNHNPGDVFLRHAAGKLSPGMTNPTLECFYRNIGHKPFITIQRKLLQLVTEMVNMVGDQSGVGGFLLMDKSSPVFFF